MSSVSEAPQPMTREDVKAFRESMGWTQADLARATGLSRPGIEKWEKPGSVVPGHWRYAFAAFKAGLEPWK